MTSHSRNILLVEPDPALALPSIRLLEQAGHQVIGVTSGEAALVSAATTQVAVCLVGLDGGGELAGVQAAELILRHHDLPLIFLLTYPDPAILQHVQTLMSYGYVLKTADAALWLAAIETACRLHAAQQAERQNAQTLENFFDLTPDLLCVASPDGYFKKINPAWERTLGYPSAELLGRPFTDFIHPDDWPGTYVEIEKQLQGGATANFTNRYRHQDGTYHWLEWTATPAQNGWLYAVACDITAQKRVENELRRSETMLKEAQNLAHLGHWYWDVVASQLVWSDEIFKIFGVDRQTFAVTADNFEKAIHPDDLTPFLKAREQMLANETETDIGHRVVRPTGEVRYVLERARVLRDAAGSPLYVMGTVQDITERKRLEDELNERQYFVQQVLDTEPGTVYIYDLLEHRNRYTNKEWLNEFGYTPEETQAMGADLMTRIFHPDDLARIQAYHQAWRSAPEGETREVEYRLCTKAGDWRWVHSHETAFTRDAAGQVTQTLGIAQDITDRKRAEEALRASEAQYHQLADENARLLREVNHRVGNNLTLLSALVETEVARAQHPEARTALAKLSGRIGSITEVHRLLQSSHWEPLALDYLVYQVVSESLSASPLAGHVALAVTPLPPSAQVVAKQASQLALMLGELTINSVKYAFTGRLTGRLEVRLAVTEAGRVHLEFRDDGPGWPPEVLRGERADVGLELMQSIVRHSWHGEIHLLNDGGAVFACDFQLAAE